jgi:hypothetical protein
MSQVLTLRQFAPPPYRLMPAPIPLVLSSAGLIIAMSASRAVLLHIPANVVQASTSLLLQADGKILTPDIQELAGSPVQRSVGRPSPICVIEGFQAFRECRREPGQGQYYEANAGGPGAVHFASFSHLANGCVLHAVQERVRWDRSLPLQDDKLNTLFVLARAGCRCEQQADWTRPRISFAN